MEHEEGEVLIRQVCLTACECSGCQIWLKCSYIRRLPLLFPVECFQKLLISD